MRPAALAAAVILLGLSGPTLAQDAPAPPPAASAEPADDAPQTLSELVVIAHPPGPALWRAQLGDSTVVILGGVSPMPQQQKWDQRQVAAALDGANLLLTQPRPDIGPLQVLGLITSNIWKVRTGKALEPNLPPEMRDRFVMYRKMALQKEDRYAHWKPVVAGYLLLSDFRHAVGMSDAKPGSTVEHLARDKHVPTQPLASYPINQLFALASRLTDQQGLICLEDVLREAAYDDAHRADIDEDWARGDVLAVAKRYRGASLQRCLEQAPGARELIDAQMNRATDRIWAALHKPGKSVAVVDMAWLLPNNGVLDRLRARGATIGAPAIAP